MNIICFVNFIDSCNNAGACSRAVQAVRSIRERLKGGSGSQAAVEQRRNFAPYNKKGGRIKGKTWTLKVVCLSSRHAHRVPCSVAERETLVQAGLGEKSITVTLGTHLIAGTINTRNN